MPGILWKLKLRYFYGWAALFFGSNVIPYSSQKEQSQANIVSDNNYKKIRSLNSSFYFTRSNFNLENVLSFKNCTNYLRINK